MGGSCRSRLAVCIERGVQQFGDVGVTEVLGGGEQMGDAVVAGVAGAGVVVEVCAATDLP